jgi:hypothetical protein
MELLCDLRPCQTRFSCKQPNPELVAAGRIVCSLVDPADAASALSQRRYLRDFAPWGLRTRPRVRKRNAGRWSQNGHERPRTGQYQAVRQGGEYL